MKVAVFGSTGKTGQHVVRHALEKGYEVVAFLRSPDKMEIEHDNLTIVQGDAEDAEAVARAVEDVDAVISALGQTSSSSSRLLTHAGNNIMQAMQEHDVDRFISLVGAGVDTPKDESTLGRKFMRGLMKLFARDVLEDAQQHSEQVMASDLDWTLVRPPRLTEDPGTGQYESGELSLGPGAKLTRDDLGKFMVEQVEDDRYVGEAPMVANA
jgi:putative NADH-flavin reductase